MIYTGEIKNMNVWGICASDQVNFSLLYCKFKFKKDRFEQKAGFERVVMAKKRWFRVKKDGFEVAWTGVCGLRAHRDSLEALVGCFVSVAFSLCVVRLLFPYRVHVLMI